MGCLSRRTTDVRQDILRINHGTNLWTRWTCFSRLKRSDFWTTHVWTYPVRCCLPARDRSQRDWRSTEACYGWFAYVSVAMGALLDLTLYILPSCGNTLENRHHLDENICQAQKGNQRCDSPLILWQTILFSCPF